MLGVAVKGYTRPCSTPVGGCDLLLVGDAADFNFTEGTPGADGEPVGYATLARRTGSGATALADIGGGGITGVLVTSGGTGYLTAPTVVFGGPGTGATAVAVVSNGAITAINVTNAGTGYTTQPTVTFVGGGATAAGGAYLYPIDSIVDTIGVEITQANADGTSSSWDYAITARMAQMCQAMTNFNKKIDAASICGQLLFVWRNNDGRIFVAGEKYVNNQQIVGFRLRQDGSKIATGKKFTEFNGQDLSIKGTYLRSAYEFTGGISALQGFIAP